MILTGCSVTGVALPLVGRDVHGSDVVLTAAADPVRALLGVRWCLKA